MPNWVLNKIKIHTTPTEFNNILDSVGNTGRLIDFNKILPVPIEGDSSWETMNWNTKTNAVDAFRMGNTIVFETAYDHPMPIIEMLSCTFPETIFEVEFANTDDFSNNTGRYKMTGGVMTDMEAPEYHSKEAIEMACEILKGGKYDSKVDFYLKEQFALSPVNILREFEKNCMEVGVMQGVVNLHMSPEDLKYALELCIDTEQYEVAHKITEVLNKK